MHAASAQRAGGATRLHEPTNPVARAPGLHDVAIARWTAGMPAWRLVAGMGLLPLGYVPSFAVANAANSFKKILCWHIYIYRYEDAFRKCRQKNKEISFED
jgi:hypothetical protein